MYKITYDQNKNRIYGNLEGFLKLDDVQAYSKELKSAIDKTKPGFTALFDNRGLKTHTPEVMEHIKEGKEYAIKKGLSKSAIVMDSAILKMQVKREVQNMSEAGSEQFFGSVEEGEAFLNK